MRCKGSIKVVYSPVNMNSKEEDGKNKEKKIFTGILLRKYYGIEEHKCLDWKGLIWMPSTMNEKHLHHCTSLWHFKTLGLKEDTWEAPQRKRTRFNTKGQE